jgi:hypothetical protein
MLNDVMATSAYLCLTSLRSAWPRGSPVTLGGKSLAQDQLHDLKCIARLALKVDVL